MFAFLRPKPAPVQRVQIIQRDPMRLTMAEWRSSPDLTHQAAQALASPIVRQLLDCARTEHLAHYMTTCYQSLEERAIQHARAEGYSTALNNIEAMGTHVLPEETLVETFEAPEPAETD